jgi:hypothetical protein
MFRNKSIFQICLSSISICNLLIYLPTYMYIWNVRVLFHTLSCFIMCHFMFMYVNIYLLSQTVNVDKNMFNIKFIYI